MVLQGKQKKGDSRVWQEDKIQNLQSVEMLRGKLKGLEFISQVQDEKRNFGSICDRQSRGLRVNEITYKVRTEVLLSGKMNTHFM